MTTFSLSRAFSGWLWLLGRDFSRLLSVGLIWSGLVYAIYGLDSALGMGQSFLPFLAPMAIEPLLIGVCTHMALSDSGQSLGSALSQSIRRFWGLFFVYILSSIGILIGFVFLILPGLALSAFWAVGIPVLLRENKSPTEALRQSFNYVRNAFWPVLALSLMSIVGALMLTGLLDVAVGDFIGSPPQIWLLSESVMSAFVGIVAAYLGAAIYRELTFGSDHDVSVFE